jgi:hypothetical protein
MSNITARAPHPRLLVRWFVQYNPLFSGSALSVLAGVYLLARALGEDAVVGLTGVLDLYQWLVIATAALLSRRLLEHRPAVILGLIQLVLMADPTLQLSALVGAGETVAVLAWVVAFAVKWRVLEWSFFLRLSMAARVLPPLAAAGIAAIPGARLAGADDAFLVAGLAVAVFACGAIVASGALRVSSTRALGDVGSQMFPRLVRAAVGVGAFAFLYQGWNATLAIGELAALPVLGAAAFAGAVAARSERVVWSLAVAGTMLMVPSGTGLLVGLPLLSVALLLASRHHPPRLFVAGVLVAYSVVLPLHAFRSGVPSAQAVLAVALASIALVHALIARRAWSAVPALLLVYAQPLTALGALLMPRGPGVWGGTLLVMGFFLLPLGAVLHRRLGHLLAEPTADDDGEGAAPVGPAEPLSTSAAIGRVEATAAS